MAVGISSGNRSSVSAVRGSTQLKVFDLKKRRGEKKEKFSVQWEPEVQRQLGSK